MNLETRAHTMSLQIWNNFFTIVDLAFGNIWSWIYDKSHNR